MKIKKIAVALLGIAASFAVNVRPAIGSQNLDPSGLWKWSIPGRNGGPERIFNLKLKADGENLTGVLITPNRTNDTFAEIEIKEGKISGDQLSFNVERAARNGGTLFVTKYTGKISADKIEGKIENPARNGATPGSTDWNAERNLTGKPIAGAKVEIKPGYDENGHKIVNETNYKLISVSDSEKFLTEHPGAVILDVRTPREYANGHLPEAKNLSVADDATYKDILASLDKSKWYLVHSEHGAWRTVRTFEYFAANGFQHAVGIDGGYQAWSEAGKPTTK